MNVADGEVSSRIGENKQEEFFQCEIHAAVEEFTPDRCSAYIRSGIHGICFLFVVVQKQCKNASLMFSRGYSVQERVLLDSEMIFFLRRSVQ